LELPAWTKLLMTRKLALIFHRRVRRKSATWNACRKISTRTGRIFSSKNGILSSSVIKRNFVVLRRYFLLIINYQNQLWSPHNVCKVLKINFIFSGIHSRSKGWDVTLRHKRRKTRQTKWQGAIGGGISGLVGICEYKTITETDIFRLFDFIHGLCKSLYARSILLPYKFWFSR